MAKASRDPADRLKGARLAVLLGSGLGGVTQGLPARARVGFDELPGVAKPDIKGHLGEITLCDLDTGPCLFIHGRKHLYEGKADELAMLIRFVARTGVRSLVITSAAGSLTGSIAPGEIVRVKDVLNLHFRWPLRARQAAERDTSPRGHAERGGRGLVLDLDLNQRLSKAAKSCGMPLVATTLASGPGPAYETQAEVWALQNSGAAVVSMSAAPELALAHALGIQVACLAVITNWVTGIADGPLSHGDVLATGARATSTLRRLIVQCVAV